MHIRRLAVHEIAEDTLAAKVERQELRLAVAAVLELHAVTLRALRGLDLRPALVNRHRGRDFGKDVLAVLHRIERNGRMQVPRRRRIDDVDVRIFAQRLVRLGSEILLRLRKTAVRDGLLLFRDFLGDDIADRRHLHPGNCRQPPDRTRPTRAKADDADTDLLHRRTPEPLHRCAFRPEKPRARASARECRQTHPSRSRQKLPSVHVTLSRLRLSNLCLLYHFNASCGRRQKQWQRSPPAKRRPEPVRRTENRRPP